MMKSTSLAVVCLLSGSASCWADGMSMPMSHAGPQSPADAANADAMHRMMTEMAAKPTGNADKDFARMMLAHHRGAIAMAKIELDYGKDSALRTLAATIIKAQEAEITVMQAWLAKH